MSIRSVVREYYLSRVFVRTFFLVFGLSLATIILSLTISTIQYEAKVSDQIKLTHDMVADRMAKEMGLFFEQTIVQLTSMSNIIKGLRPNEYELKATVNDISLTTPHLDAVLIYMSDGESITSSVTGAGLSDTQKEAIKRGMRGEQWVSDVMLDASRIPHVEISIPMLSMQEPVGVMVGRLNLKKLWWWIDQINNIAATELSVARNQDGEIVAAQNIRTIGEYSPYWALRKNKRTIPTPDGEGYVSFKAVPTVGLTLVTWSKRGTFLGYVYAVRYVIGGAALAMIVLSFIVAAISAARSSWPLMELLEAIHAFGEEGSARAPHDLAGEYGRIGKAFNDMADELESNRSALVQHESLVVVGRLASSLAHELRHGLHVIQNMIYLLSDEDAETKDILRVTVKEMTNAIEDMLEFARSDSLRIVETDLELLMDEALESVKYLEIAKGVQWSVENRTGLEAVYADRLKILSALSNLLRNGLEAGGTKLSLVIDADDDRLLFTVTDNGNGIPEEIREKVFEPFFTTRTKGFGIGLAFARIVSRAHNGEIEILSTGPDGTQLLMSMERALEMKEGGTEGLSSHPVELPNQTESE